MLKKIKRTDCLIEYPDFPQTNNFQEEFFYPKTIASYVLTLHSKSVRGHAKNLAKEIVQIVRALRLDSLVFLGDTQTPWLYQDNDYKPVKSALQYLTDNKIGKRFNGALEVYTSELQEFLVHLFWLGRCNAALPDFHFMDVDQTFIGNICKYGNLHIDIINERATEKIKAAIDRTKFENTDLAHCGGEAIIGRQTIV